MACVVIEGCSWHPSGTMKSKGSQYNHRHDTKSFFSLHHMALRSGKKALRQVFNQGLLPENWTALSAAKQEAIIRSIEARPKASNATRFVCLSDTHSRHRQIYVPPGDVLIHAGDITRHGSSRDIGDFVDWLQELPHPHKVVIAGNHDISMEKSFYEKNWQRWHTKKEDPEAVRDLLRSKCTYLEDSEVNINGIRIYGSPYQPEFHSWAFNLQRGQECRDKWNEIPQGVDVLITHGPPAGFGDLTFQRLQAGCEDLLAVVKDRKPLVHIFGHIHECYGIYNNEHTTFINASTCNLMYRPLHYPIIFDIADADDAERQSSSNNSNNNSISNNNNNSNNNNDSNNSNTQSTLVKETIVVKGKMSE